MKSIKIKKCNDCPHHLIIEQTFDGDYYTYYNWCGKSHKLFEHKCHMMLTHVHRLCEIPNWCELDEV
jgi:collagenase-like PrtC family protease